MIARVVAYYAGECIALTFTIHLFKSIETSTKKAGKVLYRIAAFVEIYSLPLKASNLISFYYKK